MKYSSHRTLLCELSKLSIFNAFNLLGYLTYTDASILVYKFRPKRTGFNVYAEYTRPQLTFLALHPWSRYDEFGFRVEEEDGPEYSSSKLLSIPFLESPRYSTEGTGLIVVFILYFNDIILRRIL